MPEFLKTALMVLAVIMCFNLIIFVHELGHFLAARWRGLQVDRFQIWFGKPIWKKEHNGVQYGLGWIPAGGFVALPQMAPMESIEGGNRGDKPLAPITPLDKIIVAFAGPLFSVLLALAAAGVVWAVGKPKDIIPTQVVGEVLEGKPARKAGILPGDKITHVNGKPVNGFLGTLDSITESIVLSKGDRIEFTVERQGAPAPLRLVSEFETEKTKWFQRGGLRQVGIEAELKEIEVVAVTKGGPAEKAGLKEGDIIISLNGKTFKGIRSVISFIKANGEKPMEIDITRAGAPMKLTATPRIPLSPAGEPPMLGAAFSGSPVINKEIYRPGPIEQVKDSVRMMWVTITSVLSPSSSIGVSHLSGPVGIFNAQMDMLKTEEGWRRVLGFLVLFNVNLAILNMLPFPVLDGGHITLAVLEKLRGRPVQAKVLEVLQTACALALMSLMLFVTSKDIGDRFNPGGQQQKKIVFPES